MAQPVAHARAGLRDADGADLKAFNTFERPALVAPQRLGAPQPASTTTFKLPARSYTVAHIATT